MLLVLFIFELQSALLRKNRIFNLFSTHVLSLRLIFHFGKFNLYAKQIKFASMMCVLYCKIDDTVDVLYIFCWYFEIYVVDRYTIFQFWIFFLFMPCSKWCVCVCVSVYILWPHYHFTELNEIYVYNSIL